MNKFKSAAFAVAALFAGFAAEAQADVITYDLTDNATFGLQNGAFYGVYGDVYSFTQNGADVKLRYDDIAGTAQIDGQGYNLTTNQLSDFNLFYDNVTLDGGRLSLTDMDTVGSVEASGVAGKGFNFDLLGDSISGDGWLTSTDGTHFGDFHLAGTLVPNGGDVAGGGAGTGGGGGAGGGAAGGAGGGQVPVPAPLSLIGAMALFGAWRRRRAIAG